MSVNPLLERIQFPGKIFPLPSGGHLYTDELIESCNGEVHVKPLSAISEIKLKNPDLLFSGKAFEEVFNECIPEIKKPMELFGKDVDSLMCYLRIVTYGSDFEIETDHGCNDSKNHSYNINLDDIVNNVEILDPTTMEKRYNVVMPNNQQVVLEPIRLRHVIELLQTNVVDKTPSIEEIQQSLVNNLLNMIKSVDGITDKKNITEWIKSVPTTYINVIADAMESANNWGPKFEHEITCKDCGESFNIELPINPVSFFTES